MSAHSLCGAVGIAALALSCAASAGQPTGRQPLTMRQALDALVRHLADQRTEQLIIVQNDQVIVEWYKRGFGRHVPHYTASLAKAIVGGMALAFAVEDSRLSPDDLACKYVPQWRSDPLKSKITIRHLATHTSGIEDAREDDIPHAQLKGWKGEFWRRKINPFLIARDQAPVLFEPGTSFHYSNPGMAMLGYCITAALRGSKWPDIRTLLRERLMRPLGVPAAEWSMSYGRDFPLDGLNLHAVWGGGAYSPEAVLRIGLMLLHGGVWQGRRILKPETVAEMVADQGLPAWRDDSYIGPASGLCWWLNSRGCFKKVPRDMYFGAGAGHQLLIVIPSMNLVVVRMGQKMQGQNYMAAIEEHLLNPLMDALRRPPYPPSEKIGRIRFAPPGKIIRKAVGSDNWPITWADDDALYTAYGDGWGFEPRVERKLSLGFAKIVGTPPDFRGVNIRSATGERTGDGPAGPKASGILMARGVLYMLVRNVGNSQLALSPDRGRTWNWLFKFSESFGCPTFLQYGRNYAGAPDQYVYIYSPDGPSAYESYNAVVLARALADELPYREAYEFFAGAKDGKPMWTRDITKRVPVFEYPGHCARIEVVYCPPLKRYLMLLGFDHRGGWGMFDAPEPWGPWTTAFFTLRWDMGNTHSYRLPTKWISPDGRRAWLVFSGRPFGRLDNDAFCVREMFIDARSQ